VTMDFEIVLRNPKDNSDLWKERMSQIGVYEAGTQTEEDAQREALGRLVDAIVNRTTKVVINLPGTLSQKGLSGV